MIMENKLLQHRTILITRPKHQAQPLIDLIRAFGGNTILLPVLEIESLAHTHAFKRAIDLNPQPDIAIFTSANAVEPALSYWQPAPATLTIAIGPGTQNALRQHQINVNAMPREYSSAGILQLPQLATLNQKSIQIYCGENPKPDLKAMLSARGALVHEVFCYRRIKPLLTPQALALIEGATIDEIVLTSRESLENFVSLLPTSRYTSLYASNVVVIHPDQAILAKTLGFTGEINVATSAADEDVVQALIRKVE